MQIKSIGLGWIAAAGCVTALCLSQLPWIKAAQAADDVTLTVAMAANPQMETAEKLVDQFYARYPPHQDPLRHAAGERPSPHRSEGRGNELGTVRYCHDRQLRGAALGPERLARRPVEGLTWRKTRNNAQGDLLKPIADLMQYKGDMFGLPFYGSSSFMFYRKDLFRKAGITMPEHPTWRQIAGFADKLNHPSDGYLRHLPARRPGLGTEPRRDNHRHQCLRRPLVRREMASAINGAKHQEGGAVLRRSTAPVRPAGCRQGWLAGMPAAVHAGQKVAMWYGRYRVRRPGDRPGHTPR